MATPNTITKAVYDQIKELLDGGETLDNIVRRVGRSKATVVVVDKSKSYAEYKKYGHVRYDINNSYYEYKDKEELISENKKLQRDNHNLESKLSYHKRQIKNQIERMRLKENVVHIKKIAELEKELREARRELLLMQRERALR
jgi:hypothetical protein